MTTATGELRLGILEGRMTEQAAAIAGLRDDIRDLRADVRGLTGGLSALASRIDRLLIAVLIVGAGIGVAQVGLLAAIIPRT